MNLKLPSPQKPVPALTLGERIAEKVRALGLAMPERPEGGAPPLPPDITNVTPQTLSWLHGQYSVWSEFLAVETAKASNRKKEADLGAKTARKLRRDEAEALEWDWLALEAGAETDVLEALCKGVMRRRETCSREITRITGGISEPQPRERGR